MAIDKAGASLLASGGVIARQETGPDKSGEVQVAGMFTPAAKKAGQLLGRSVDRTGVLESGRRRSEII